MKKQILIVLGLAFLLIGLKGIMGMTTYCGDSYCDTSYFEDNPTHANYCPADCGVIVNETWCNETYPRTCPVCATCAICGSCSECTISHISNSSLNNWCDLNGYSQGDMAGWSSDLTSDKYSWGIIGLIIGGIIGYYYKNKK